MNSTWKSTPFPVLKEIPDAPDNTMNSHLDEQKPRDKLREPGSFKRGPHSKKGFLSVKRPPFAPWGYEDPKANPKRSLRTPHNTGGARANPRKNRRTGKLATSETSPTLSVNLDTLSRKNGEGA